jgi:hypothetical protein
LVVRGDVLAPGGLYLDGTLRIVEDGTIGCVGCACDQGLKARVIECPDSVVSPAFVNPHDHIAYAHQPPRPGTAERYDHRHEWRLGLNGHAAIAYEGGAPSAARAAHELRLLLGGATTVAGGAGCRGLLRNPDLSGLSEGLPSAGAGSDTFPLDDAQGLLVSSGCRYGSDRTRSEEVYSYGGYLPHLGEGVSSAAANEIRCALTPAFDLVHSNTGLVHAVAATAADALELGRRQAVVVWSPRSNLSLYGNTAPVPLLLRSGVELALGTDWLLSGSMNVLRELDCARTFASTFWSGAVDDLRLFRMATASAARAVGAGGVLGQLSPGFLADILLIRRRKLNPHTAVVTAGPADIELVLRGGSPLYGREALVHALTTESCEALDVCGAAQQVCTADAGFSLAELAAATAGYPLFSCEAPPNEPVCTPFRPNEYDGVGAERDHDGDGIPDRDDLCSAWFDPPRPLDGDRQADADGDGQGDLCDPCPLDEDRDCTGPRLEDRDGDSVPETRDLCPNAFDPEQGDADGDQVGDACDFCAAPNPGATPCPLPIAALSDPLHPEHPPRHALVQLPPAEVTALRPNSGDSRGYYVQTGTTAFSGIFVFTGSTRAGVSVGDRVTLRGRFDQYYGSDQVVPLELLAHDVGEPTLLPLDVEAAWVADGGAFAEGFELMLVRVAAARVTDPNPDAPSDYDEFLLDGGLRVDDLLFPELTNDFPAQTEFSTLTGVLGRSFDHMKLWPRGPSDVTPNFDGLSVSPD